VQLIGAHWLDTKYNLYQNMMFAVNALNEYKIKYMGNPSVTFRIFLTKKFILYKIKLGVLKEIYHFYKLRTSIWKEF
jgi:hypothetical protein